MFNKKTIDDLNLNGKYVLLRCDFNVPIRYDEIIDETRILYALPTIKKLINDKAKIILCSHLGKPKIVERKFSLKPIAKRLSEHLGKEVIFIEDSEVVGEKTKAKIKNMLDGDVLLLENTRFRKEETKNEDSFSKELGSLVDIYINDAFGSCHRIHCSTVGVTKFVKETAIGYLIEKEIKFLGSIINNPKRPFAAILGGAKVSDKLDVINNLIDKVDILIIGGGMSYTFSKAQGYNIGKSILEEDKISYAKKMMDKAKEKGVKLFLPIDALVVKEFKNDTNFRRVDISEINDDEIGIDIGEKTIKLFFDALKDVKTVIWNGPMGVFEFENFTKGTMAIVKVLSDIDAVTIIGGGDSVAAINLLGFGNKMTHISTGGGASLEFLEGKVLPGIEAIENK